MKRLNVFIGITCIAISLMYAGERPQPKSVTVPSWPVRIAVGIVRHDVVRDPGLIGGSVLEGGHMELGGGIYATHDEKPKMSESKKTSERL